jgi:dipeptidyl aminopeptidase/acylaminoacyl peptidase
MRHHVLTVAAVALVACSRGAPARPDAPPRAAFRDSAPPAAVEKEGPAAAGLASATLAPSATELDPFEQQVYFKQLTDLGFHEQLGGEMLVRKVQYASVDGMSIPAYYFAPRDTSVRRPAIIMVHGGVHGDFDLVHVPQVRALVRRGYVVIAPEYRGSTGYGKAHFDAIDYGGKEVDDAVAAVRYLADSVPNADTSLLGVMGWSHGGFISFHAVVRHPELFKVAIAHVPVADLPSRIRSHSPSYQQIFADQPGFGGTLAENPGPYVERSPIAQARRLRTPLLVHTADNDEDVFIVENHNLRDSMIAAGKDRAGLYRYREWHNPPGGHSFGVLDTPQGRESWAETIAFLDRYLHPPGRR